MGSYLIEPTGEYKEVTNLGWLLKNWHNVDSFTVQTVTPFVRLKNKKDTWELPLYVYAQKHCDSVMIANLKDDRWFVCTWASYSVMLDWLHRPVFVGVSLNWFSLETSIQSGRKTVTVSAEKLNGMIAEVQRKLNDADNETVVNVDNAMAITFDEHFRFQQLQAESHAGGLLTPDAAQIVYNALGEVGSDKNGGWSSLTSTATKVIVTKLMSELLERKINKLQRV